MNHVDIKLAGGTLSVDFTEAFLDKVRSGLHIPGDQAVTRHHIKTFIRESVRCAIEKHERDNESDET